MFGHALNSGMMQQLMVLSVDTYTCTPVALCIITRTLSQDQPQYEPIVTCT